MEQPLIELEKTKICSTNNKPQSKQINQLEVNVLPPKPARKEFLVVKENGKRTIILFENIIRIEADRSYCHVWTKNELPLLCSKNMKQLENKLNPNLFCKVHRSHIVNYMEIRRFSGTRGGIILMNDGTEIPVSIRRKAKFLNGLDEFAAYNRRDVHNVE